MTKSRIFLCALLFFIFGIAVRSFVYVSYGLLLLGYIVCAMLVVVGVSRRKGNLLYHALFIFCFLFGIFRFHWAVRPLDDPHLFGTHTFIGVIEEEPETHTEYQNIPISLRQVDHEPILHAQKILATVRKYPDYTVGDRIEFSGALRQLENFGEFDTVSYLRSKHIVGVVSFPAIEKVGEEHTFTFFLFRFKKNFDEKIDLLFREPHGALLRGLLLGERSTLPQEFIDALKGTGTTHIVALSGYNITIVGKYILALLLLVTIPFHIAFWLACLCIVLFVIVTGASASAVRAGVMGVLVLLAQNEGRMYRMTNALVFAAAVMIYINPLILRFDAGFQLSFLATCGILYLPRYVELYSTRAADAIHKKRKVLARDEQKLAITLKTTLIETLSAQIFVLPWLLYVFGTVSLVSPIVNMMVLPAIPYAMGWGFFAVLAGFIFTPFARIVAFVGWILLTYVFLVIEWFAKIPFASISFFTVPWYVPFTLYGALILWLKRQRTTKK